MNAEGGSWLCSCNGNGSSPGVGSGPLEVTTSMSPTDSISRVHPWGRAQTPAAPPALDALSSSQEQHWQRGWVGRLSTRRAQPSPKGCDATELGATLLPPPHQGTVPLSLLSPAQQDVCNGWQWAWGGLGDLQLWTSAHGHALVQRSSQSTECPSGPGHGSGQGREGWGTAGCHRRAGKQLSVCVSVPCTSWGQPSSGTPPWAPIPAAGATLLVVPGA